MKLALLGDIGLFGSYSHANGAEKKVTEVAAYLSDFDYVIANLETPLTDSNHRVFGKSAYIKGAPQDVSTLRALGVTHVNLANNHILDYGKRGLRETIHILEENKINWFGVYGKTNTMEDTGSRVILHGYCCYTTNALGMGEDGVSPFNIQKIEIDIDNDKENNAMSLISVHWGEEHVNYPNPAHIAAARMIAQKGAVIIHGHHPHVLQGMERINSSLIAYSLGNFIFDDVITEHSTVPLIELSENNRKSGILAVTIDKNVIINTEFIPTYISEDKIQITYKNARKDEMLDYSRGIPEDIGIKYAEDRSRQLDNYYRSRKKLRNINWYFKRLRPRYAAILIRAKINKRCFNESVVRYIGNYGN